MRQLDRLVARARAVLFWEQLWRALVPPLVVVGLFVAVSFAGLWLEIGPLWRELGVGLFGIALVAALCRSLACVLQRARPRSPGSIKIPT